MDVIHLNHLINFDIGNESLTAKVFDFKDSRQHFEKKYDVSSQSLKFGKESCIVCCKAALCPVTNVLQPFVLIQSINNKKHRVTFTLCQLRDFKTIHKCFSFDKHSFKNAHGIEHCKKFFITETCVILALDITTGHLHCIQGRFNKQCSPQPRYSGTSEPDIVLSHIQMSPSKNIFQNGESVSARAEIIRFSLCISDPKQWLDSPCFSSEARDVLKKVELDVFSCGWVAIDVIIDRSHQELPPKLHLKYSQCKIPPVYSTYTSALFHTAVGTTLIGTTANQLVGINSDEQVTGCTDLPIGTASRILVQNHDEGEGVIILSNETQVCAVDLNSFVVINTWSNVSCVCQGDFIIDSNICNSTLILYETSLSYGLYITNESYKLVLSKEDCVPPKENETALKRDKPLFDSFDEDIDKDLFDSNEGTVREDSDVFKSACKNFHGILQKKKESLAELKHVSLQMEETVQLGKMQYEYLNSNIKLTPVEKQSQIKVMFLIDNLILCT